MVGQHRNIFETLTQWRRRDRDHIEPVIQILAELSCAYELHQVAVRSGDYPNIHANGFRAADALELALLQDAQQLGLDVQRQVAYFIQEQRSPVRSGDYPNIHANGFRAADALELA